MPGIKYLPIVLFFFVNCCLFWPAAGLSCLVIRGVDVLCSWLVSGGLLPRVLLTAAGLNTGRGGVANTPPAAPPHPAGINRLNVALFLQTIFKRINTRLSWMIFNQTRTARVSDYIPDSFVRPWNTNQGSSEKNPSHFSLKCTLLRVNSCKHCNSIDLTKFNNICWCRNLFSIAICKCTPVQSENSQKLPQRTILFYCNSIHG